MKPSLTLKNILLFFLPLIFMAELIQISHAVTNAFLARLLAPKETIAAFSIAFALNIMAGGITMSSIQTGICFIDDRSSFRPLLRFCFLMVSLSFLTVEIISLTSLGDLVFGGWMGASPPVVAQTKKASAVMGLWHFPILIRNLCYAMAMVRRRTILITYATIVRLAGLVGFLIIYSIWFDGAVVGALATVSGMTIEAVYMVFATRSFFRSLKESDGPQASFSEFWSFSWPLMVMQISENGVLFVANLFLGRLVNPDLAIASFGVVYGLVRLILAGPRNLVQTAQTLVHDRQDLKPMFQFTAASIVVYTGIIFLLFYTPINDWILSTVMGLTVEMHRYCNIAVKLTFLVAIFWSTAAMLRGILSAIRKTFVIAVSAGIRLVAVAGIGFVAFLHPEFNGAILGVFAIAGSFAAETIALGWYFWNLSKSTKPLFVPRTIAD